MSEMEMKTDQTELSTLELIQTGQKDAIPVALGYFAVSFALGIAMRNAGIGPITGFIISALNMASAGEYAGTTMIAAHATLIETGLMVLAANARYLLMSTAFSQKFSETTKMVHRIIIGCMLTDEMFALAIRRKGYLEPPYYYGMLTLTVPGWATGTMLGILFGTLLPSRIVSALSVALFAMFLAVIIPPCRTNSVLRIVVLASFGLSLLFTKAPVLRDLSEGVRMIGLTIVIAAIAAALRPVREEDL